MRSVLIIGIGQTPVGELSGLVRPAVGLSGNFQHADLPRLALSKPMRCLSAICSVAICLTRGVLGALVADFCGLHGIETAKVEAACASGPPALRVGAMAVASGFHDIVIVAGLEKMADDTVGKDATGPKYWPQPPTPNTKRCMASVLLA